jgi:hypothetical protein
MDNKRGQERVKILRLMQCIKRLLPKILHRKRGGVLKNKTFILVISQLNYMELNKSQIIIIKTIASSMLGFPNIDKIFTEEIIRIAMENPSHTMIIVVSFLKIILVISSVIWLYQLLNNALITYQTKSRDVFINVYLAKLVLTGLVTAVGMYLLLLIIPI